MLFCLSHTAIIYLDVSHFSFISCAWLLGKQWYAFWLSSTVFVSCFISFLSFLLCHLAPRHVVACHSLPVQFLFSITPVTCQVFHLQSIGNLCRWCLNQFTSCKRMKMTLCYLKSESWNLCLHLLEHHYSQISVISSSSSSLSTVQFSLSQTHTCARTQLKHSQLHKCRQKRRSVVWYWKMICKPSFYFFFAFSCIIGQPCHDPNLM